MLRSCVRRRARLVAESARCVQHVRKALAQMNVRLDTVSSDVMGKTGRAIVRALVAGERGAAMRRCWLGCAPPRVKADEATVARSLQGQLAARRASVRPGSGVGTLRLPGSPNRAVRGADHGHDERARGR